MPPASSSSRSSSSSRAPESPRPTPSPAAAAAHAAVFVAAVILVLPNAIPTATALISDRLWNHLLDILHCLQLMWLAAAASSVRAVAQHHARSRSPSLVLRWPGGRLLCLRLLPPRVHRREQVRPIALEPHVAARGHGCLRRCALTTRMPVLVCLRFAAGTGAAGALKKCQIQKWPSEAFSESPVVA